MLGRDLARAIRPTRPHAVEYAPPRVVVRLRVPGYALPAHIRPQGIARRAKLGAHNSGNYRIDHCQCCLSDDSTSRTAAWLTAWDSQGIHRTATAGDEAGAEWLIREATSLGAAPIVEKFALDRLDPIKAYLEFDGIRIP